VRERTISIPNGRGQHLAGRLSVPVGEARGAAVFAHCFTCGKDLPSARRISEAFTQAGIAVLRFDFTGIGQSEGDHADTSFVTQVEDLAAAAATLRSEVGSCDALVGHSLGGAAALLAARAVEGVRAVVTIGAPFDPSHVVRHFEAPALAPGGGDAVEVVLAGRPIRLGRRFFEDLAGVRMAESIRDLRRPLLVMHAPLDEVVGVENAARIFEAARHPKSFLSLEGADHLLRRPSDARYAGHMAAAFVAQHLPPSAPVKTRPVTVHLRIGRDHYRTEVESAGHRLVADEPTSLGGAGTGPGPYELVAAGLGACTAMTLRMVADREAIPLEAVEVDLTHEKRHAEDARACEAGRAAKIDAIDRRIRLFGPLTPAHVARLSAVANKCPVHRSLTPCIHIDTRVTVPPEGGGPPGE